MSENMKKVWLPLLIAILAYLFTLATTQLEFVQNIEYQITDSAKFRVKDHKEPVGGENQDPSELVDSPVMILGITEKSQFTYLMNLYGQFPWPREAYADFLSYFRLNDPRLKGIDPEAPKLKSLAMNNNQQKPEEVKQAQDVKNGEEQNNGSEMAVENTNQYQEMTTPQKEEKHEVDEVKELTWNSIHPRILFFDIFFDNPRLTKISFEPFHFQKDFGDLVHFLQRKGKNITNYENIIKTWSNNKRFASDQKFYDELKRQKDKDYIFVDYALQPDKEGRIQNEDIVRQRFQQLSKFELKNVYDINGNKIEIVPDEDPFSLGYAFPPIGYDIKAPLLNITKNIAGSGAANILADRDGKRRKMPLIYRVYDERIMVQPIFLPTIGMNIAMKYYNVKPDDVIVELGKSITLKNATIRKRIHYVRRSLIDSDKTYKWTEYIDSFMDYIIEKVIENSEKGENGNFKIKYKTILDKLQSDDKLKKLLQEKFKKNNLKITINDKMLKKEIDDFLISLSETSCYNVKDGNFFNLEDRVFKISVNDNSSSKENKKETDQSGEQQKLNLIQIYEEIDQKYNILKNLLKQEIFVHDDLRKEKQIRFIDNQTGKISYNNIYYEKNEFLSFIASLASKYYSPTTEVELQETQNHINILINNNYIDINGKIKDLKKITEYKNKIIDNTKLTKYIDYLVALNEIENVLTILNDKELIKYKVKKGEHFSLLNPDGFVNYKSSVIDEKELIILEQLQSWIEFEENNLKELYKEIENDVSQEKFKKVINNLVELKIISDEYIYLDILDLKELEDFREKLNLQDKAQTLRYKQLITRLIEATERVISINPTKGDWGKFYTLDKKTVLKYLKNETNLPTNKIEEKLKEITVNQSVTSGGTSQIKTLRIILTDSDVRISNPNIFYKEIEKFDLRRLIIKQLLEYSSNQKTFPYYKTIYDISLKIGFHPESVGNEIDEMVTDPVFANSLSIDIIPEQNREISGNIGTLKSYRKDNKNIVIPIDEQGQLYINFQGRHQSFANDDFGKYMGISRLRRVQSKNYIIPPPYDAANSAKTPDFAWEKLKNKIILIGFYTTAGLGEKRDYFETPYGSIFGVEIHANALETLLSRKFIEHLPTNILTIGKMEIPYEWLIMLIFVLMFGLAIPKLSILRGFLFFFITLTVYVFFNFLYVFRELRLDVPLVGTILSMLFTFIALIVYKLMTEEKDKRKIKGMFSKYVSADVVNTLLESSSKLELGGEDRELTVLFSDIRGFTNLSESLGNPQDLVNHLNVYLTEMTELVIQYKGTLDKYIGDALMAFWGAPLDIPDHPLLACQAAIKMMERLDELNKDWPDHLKIRIGIGLNTGTMTVGNMGSSKRMDYTIMGDPVNLGSRVESVNKMYGTEIIITEYTYEHVKDHVIVRELDFITVKGKTEPVVIYELLDMIE